MNSFNIKYSCLRKDSESPGVSAESSNNNKKKWALGDDVFCCHEMSFVDESVQAGMSSVQSGLEGHLPLLHRGAQSELLLDLNSPEAYLDGSPLDFTDPDRNNGSPQFERRKRSRSNSSRHRFNEVVTELVPEEVRWFYKEDKKTWKPFLGHDSLKMELMFRKYCELNPSCSAAVRRKVSGERRESGSTGPESPEPNGAAVPGETASCSAREGRGSSDERDPDGIEINVEPVCVRGGLYEVDIKEKECFPVYWKRKFRRGLSCPSASTTNALLMPFFQ